MFTDTICKIEAFLNFKTEKMKILNRSIVALLFCFCVTGFAQVGLGTVSFVPVNKLDVNGSMAIGTYAGINTAPSNGLIVSGNTGIATPSAASYALTIANGSSGHIGLYDSNTGILKASIYGNGSQLIINDPNNTLDPGDFYSHLKFASGFGQDAFRFGSDNNESYLTNGRSMNFCAGESAPHTSSATPILTLIDNNTRALGIGVVPGSQLDILGTNGYAQLRLRTSYTPTSSADTNGNVGDIAWDDNYFYMRVSSGATKWVRSALSAF